MTNASDSMKRYVVLGLARSGTTVVHFALKGHPNVAALNDEVKVSFFTEGISAFTQRDDNILEKKVGSLSLFDSIAGVFAGDKTQALGLKCVPDSAAASRKLIDTLNKYYPDLRIVLVVRDDMVSQYGSMLLATLTGNWHSWRKSGKSGKEKVKISKWRFKKYIYNTLAKLNELRELKKTHAFVEFNFEKQLLTPESPDFSPLFKFIDIPDLKVTWLNSKKVAPPPEDYIVNYETMKRYCDEILQHEKAL